VPGTGPICWSSSRTKRSKTSSRLSAGMPMPLSLTAIAGCSGLETVTVTRGVATH
jgi:hypothetical protein